MKSSPVRGGGVVPPKPGGAFSFQKLYVMSKHFTPPRRTGFDKLVQSILNILMGLLLVWLLALIATQL